VPETTGNSLSARTRFAILGGGLAGISAARSLGTEATVIEAEDRLGGLARTDVERGFWFDWTGHWLHLRTPKWKSEVERLLPGGLLTIERNARIFGHGAWTPFPFQVNLHGLPPDVVADCLAGFIAANVGPEGEARRAAPLKTFHDFTLRYLGEGINRHFMEPYNRKLYTVDPAELSADWGGRFVPRPSLAEVIDGAVGKVRTGLGYNATFVYPRHGGIEAFAKAVASPVESALRLGTRVTKLRWKDRAVDLSDGTTLSFEKAISTLPLKRVAGLLDPLPDAIRDAAAKLRSISVTVVEFGVRGAPRVPFHWAYFAGPEVPFYRVGSPSQVNPALAPEGHCSYAVEFSHQGPPPAHDTLIRDAIAGLQLAGILAPEDVVLARVRTIPTAYVLVDHAHAEARKTLVEFLNAHGIEVAGRFGNWEYSGMEDALVSGEAAAMRVLGG